MKALMALQTLHCFLTARPRPTSILKQKPIGRLGSDRVTLREKARKNTDITPKYLYITPKFAAHWAVYF